MAWLSCKFIILVLTACVQCAPEGYVYSKPNIQLDLPNEQIQQTYQTDQVKHGEGLTFQKTVSYSVSHEDYEYLKQHKNDANIRSNTNSYQNFNNYNEGSLITRNNYPTNEPLNIAIPVNDYTKESVNIQNRPLGNIHNSATIVSNVQYAQPLVQLQNTIAIPKTETGLINSSPVQNVPSFVQGNDASSLSNTIDIQTSKGLLNNVASTQEVHIANSVSPAFVQNNIQPINVPFEYFQPINTNFNNHLNVPNIQNSLPIRQNVEPVITKHIYFHVPPADIEETPKVSIPSPKKSYKILFIKVPNQEVNNIATIQKNLYSKLVPIEEKTLIYVLVKNPEEPQITTLVNEALKPSEHEVLFVKYKGNPDSYTDNSHTLINPSKETSVNLQSSLSNGYQ